MARKLIMRRSGQRLECVDPYSAELLEEIKEGVELSVSVATKRSNPQSNLFHVGLSYCVENIFEGDMQRKYPTGDKLKKALLTELGYVSEVYRIDGSISFEVDSTRFDAMDGEVFTEFFDRARTLMWEWIERDPWEEWLEMKREDDARRRAYMRGR